jgi:hypothetical protein
MNMMMRTKKMIHLSWDDLLKTNDWTDEEWNEAMMD